LMGLRLTYALLKVKSCLKILRFIISYHHPLFTFQQCCIPKTKKRKAKYVAWNCFVFLHKLV
jgi:hypothetical protein